MINKNNCTQLCFIDGLVPENISFEYQSTVGSISVTCRLNIGRVLGISQVCLIREMTTSVIAIMLGGDFTVRYNLLFYEVKQRALRELGM